MCISDNIQTSFSYLGRFLKKYLQYQTYDHKTSFESGRYGSIYYTWYVHTAFLVCTVDIRSCRMIRMIRYEDLPCWLIET